MFLEYKHIMADAEKLWKKYFDGIFEGGDEEDKKWKSRVEKYDPQRAKQHIEKILEVINGEVGKMSVTDFTHFKRKVLELEKELMGKKHLFRWTLKSFSMIIKWDVLAKDPKKYFCVHMGIENFWGLPQCGWSKRKCIKLPEAFAIHPERDECEIDECMYCGKRDCPHGNIFHYFKTGCIECKITPDQI